MALLQSVYLAGPFLKASDTQMNEWRELATEELEIAGIGVRNPVSRLGLPAGEVVRGDLDDIDHCDALLGWVNHELPSVGTNMEIFYAAHVKNIPVFLFGESFPRSPWHVYHATGYYRNIRNALGATVQALKAL